VYDYTAIFNTVAIVTNGRPSSGWGTSGGAGMPVMEGKAALFSELVGINGVRSSSSRRTPKRSSARWRRSRHVRRDQARGHQVPECFEIEDRLSAMLDIPVLHDDQHGTSVVVLAALLNASQYVGMQVKDDTVGMVGLGPPGSGSPSS